MAGQMQHVQFYRKYLLRKRLLRWAKPGAVYVPFIGDGDLAVKLYADRQIYGADLDPDRVATARTRLTGDIRVSDCDIWPFPDLKGTTISIADFDAYANPYNSFRAFWKNGEKADRMVLFFTDGHRMGLMRSGHWHLPDGSKQTLSGNQKTAVFHFYLNKHIWPWFEDYVKPYDVIDRMRYLRGLMTYWGAVIEKRSSRATELILQEEGPEDRQGQSGHEEDAGQVRQEEGDLGLLRDGPENAQGDQETEGCAA